MTDAEKKEAKTVLAFADNEFRPGGADDRFTAAKKLIAEVAGLPWPQGMKFGKNPNERDGRLRIDAIENEVVVSALADGSIEVRGARSTAPRPIVKGLHYDPTTTRIEIGPEYTGKAQRLGAVAVVLDEIFAVARQLKKPPRV
jgi:hypothetical protein